MFLEVLNFLNKVSPKEKLRNSVFLTGTYLWCLEVPHPSCDCMVQSHMLL